MKEELKSIIREFVLLEIGPVTNSDGSGMVDFMRPSTDAEAVEAEFDYNAFRSFVRKSFRADSYDEEDLDISQIANKIAMRNRKLSGIEIDTEELEKELLNSEKEEEEFYASTPEEKVRYYADPKWYTRFF